MNNKIIQVNFRKKKLSIYKLINTETLFPQKMIILNFMNQIKKDIYCKFSFYEKYYINSNGLIRVNDDINNKIQRFKLFIFISIRRQIIIKTINFFSI